MLLQFLVTNMIEGIGRAIVIFPIGTKLITNNAIFSLKYQRNMLSFKDICKKGYHI